MKQLYLKVLGILVLLLPNYLAFSQNQIQRATNPFTMAMGTFTGRMIVGDFDKDGDVDVLYQNGNVAGAGFGFFKNNGGGVYQDFPDATVGAGNPFAGFSFAGENMTANSLFVFDYDGDGDMDILDRDPGADPATTMGIWRNENGTSFTELPIPFTTPAAWNVFYGRMILGDFDTDGDKDILFQAGNTASTGFGYIRNNGGGSFTTFDNANNAGNPFTTFDFTNQQMTALMVVDYDNDGDVDIIDRDISAGGSLGVWKNNSGVFQFDAGPFTTLDNAPFYNRIIFGDFDSDGDQDALFQKGNTISAGFGYASNNGSGVYTISANATAAAGPFLGFDFTNEQLSTLFVFDYDNDGDVDIIDRDLVGAGGQIGVWKQLGIPPVRISTSPLDDATTVSPTANIILTFNETVTKGTGNIYLYNATTNLVVATLPVGDAGVTSSDNLSWTINFPGNFTPNITYAVHLDAGIFKDADNMATAAITNNTTFNFFVPPPVPPTITNLNGDAAAYTEAGAPAKLDVGGNANASDNLPDFDGAVLTVSFTANAIAAQDILGIENQGVAAGQIGISGANVTYGGVTFAIFTGGTSPANLVVTMNSSASYAAVTALLRALTYSNNSNNANANIRNISISITDAETAVATANVTASITRVNNPPVLTAPVNITVKEDENKLLTGISFTDPDGTGTAARVTFTTTTGSFIASALAGVTITGNNTTTLILDGTTTVLNTYLSGASNVAFAFAANQSSNVLVNVLVSDLGNTGGTAQTDSKDIQILGTAVNDMPVITAPASISVTEDVLANLSGFSFTDIDAGTSPVDVTLSVPSGSGTITAAAMAGVTITNVSVNEVKLTGTLTNLNSYISGNNVGFTTALNNASNVILTVKINDGGFTGDDPGTSGTVTTEEFSTNITLTVAAVNDVPTITSPANYAVTEDIAAPINGVAFLDVDAGTSNLTQAVFTVSPGTLTATSGGGVTVTGSGTASVTLQGTRANINAFITANSLTYNVAGSQTTDATISISYNDAGDVGTGGALTANAGPIPINVTFVNDRPSITAPGSINVQEDVLSSLAGYSFSDVDAAAAAVDVTLSVPSGSGSITAAAMAGITISTISANEVMISGSVANINSYIVANNIGFTTALNNTANVILTIKINDRGNTGTDPGTSGTPTSEEATATVTITIAAVNDQPTITAPANFTSTEDVSSPINGIIFNDVDGGTANTTQANITVSPGALNATSGGGVTVTGSGTGSITLQGTRANINAFIAANSLQYLTAAAQTTNATLSMTYNDAGDVGTGGALIANAGPLTIIVTFVNDAPTIVAPGSINVNEDLASALAGYSFTDVDAAAGIVDVTLSVPAGNGTLTAVAGSGVTVNTISSNQLILSGTVADVNSFVAANKVNFTTALNNTANVTLTIKINDLGNTGTDPGTSGTSTSEEATATVTLIVAAANDAPTITAPPAYAVTEDIPTTIGGISFADVDGGTSITTQATLTVSMGTLSATSGGGVTVAGAGTGTLTLTGSRININAFIAANNIQYNLAAAQTTDATLNISYNDAGDVGTGGAMSANAGPIPLNVTYINDRPVITAPASITVQEDLLSALAGYSFTDIDAAVSLVDVTLSVPSGSGTLTAVSGSGITVTTVSPNELRLAGTVTALNSYISASNVGFTTALNNVSNITLTIIINDRGNTGTDPGTSGTGTSEEATATVTIMATAVNDAPTITAPASYAVTEDAPATINGVIINDVDGGTSATTQATFTVSLGTLSATSGGGVTVTGGGAAAVTLQGTMANINAFIAAGNLQYNNALTQTTNATLNISFNDAGDIGTGGALVANAGPIPLNVTYINDVPVITAPASINVQEDLLSALTGYSFSDIDAGTSSVDVTLAVPAGSGTLTAAAMAGITVTTISPNAVMISGNITNINSYISANKIGFTTALNNTANVTLTITVNDGGNTGTDPGTSGTATSEEASTTTTLMVTAINDAPVINAQLDQSTLMDIAKVFNTANSNLISVSDVDAGSAQISMRVEASAGLLNLSGTTGLTFTTGDGTADAIMQFTGTLANINAALNGLSLAPPIGILGDIIITLKADDLGNSPGAALSDTKVLTLHVLPSTPTVLSVSSSTPDGAYKVGDVLQITVTFNQPVNVTGTPALTLETGATDRQANYTSGSGTSTLTFSYTVQSGDQSADLDYASINALTIAGGNVRNGSLLDAALGLPATGSANSIAGSKNLVIDGVAPFITSVNIPVNKTYVAGQPLNFSLNFSEVITVNTTGGTPGITVQLESGPVQATYVSGSGSNVLLYRYVVATGNLDNIGIALGIHALNGATLKDATGNDALLTLNGVPATTGILVDAADPVVTSVTVPANKIWKAGEVLNFTVNFSEPVIKTGATDPFIILTIGSSQVQATYKSGTGTNAYLFSYTIVTGDLDRNGIAVGPSPSISLNGVTLKDAAGNDANLLLNNIGSLLNVWVDAVTPIVTASQVFSVAENSAAATAVGTVQGTDPGSTGTLQQWTITSNVNPDGDANPAFAINAATGAITVNDAGDLNFEATSSLTISVSVSDGVNTSAAQTVVINLTNMPEPPLDIALSNNTILENNASGAQVGLLSATSSETGTTYTYTLVAGGADNTSFSIVGNSLRAAVVFDAETKTTYNIRIRATTQAGEFLEKPFVVTVTNVNEAPTLNAITDRPYCATTAEVVIPLTGITPGPETTQTTTVSVSSNNAGLFTQLTADNTAIRLRFAAGANGNVTVTVTVKDNGGTANNGTDQVVRSFNIAVTSIAAPVITSNKGTKVSKGDFAALTATGGVSYVWDNSPGIISGQNSNVLNIRPQQNVTYRVTASNAAGCSASAQLAIEVIDDYKVNSANIMTPNGDGVNDRFIIKNIDSYPSNELKIFDRSGRLIYTKRGYQNEWDGKINGKALEEGTYYFMLDFGPGLPKVKGFITIIRDKK